MLIEVCVLTRTWQPGTGRVLDVDRRGAVAKTGMGWLILGAPRRLGLAMALGMGMSVTTSLAGEPATRWCRRASCASAVRRADGLATICSATAFDRLVDATHPYAVQMARPTRSRRRQQAGVQAGAADAAGLDGAAICVLVPCSQTCEQAADGLPSGARVLLTVGPSGISTMFLARDDCSFVVRSIEPPDATLPAHATALLARPPYLRRRRDPS